MADALPSTLAVPPEGLPEADVFAALGLTWRDVYPLLGDELLSPRDYRYPSRPHFSTNYYTPAGVRALVIHFGLRLDVRDPNQHEPTKQPEFWWQQDNS